MLLDSDKKLLQKISGIPYWNNESITCKTINPGNLSKGHLEINEYQFARKKKKYDYILSHMKNYKSMKFVKRAPINQ